MVEKDLLTSEERYELELRIDLHITSEPGCEASEYFRKFYPFRDWLA